MKLSELKSLGATASKIELLTTLGQQFGTLQLMGSSGSGVWLTAPETQAVLALLKAEHQAVLDGAGVKPDDYVEPAIPITGETGVDTPTP